MWPASIRGRLPNVIPPDSRSPMTNQPHIAKSATRDFPPQGVPIIHQINWLGLWTLYMKEVRRFFKVQTQTIWAPAITTLLNLVIFTIAFGSSGGRGGHIVMGVNFASFIAPGLMVMGMMQAAFANASFSFLSGKIQGTIIDFLMPPLSEAELMCAMIAASVTRAVLIGFAMAFLMAFWPGLSLHIAHPWAVVWFGMSGAVLLALIGFLSSIWAEKFDHNAAITSFVVFPLTLLSGTFYVIDNLAPLFQTISRFNPFFYVISGFRFGFLGQSDIGATNEAVLHGAMGLGALNVVLAVVTYKVLRSGWKLKS